MNYLTTIFTVEWLAHNNINISVVNDIDELYLAVNKDYISYTKSEHFKDMKTSTLQTIKNFLSET